MPSSASIGGHGLADRGPRSGGAPAHRGSRSTPPATTGERVEASRLEGRQRLPQPGRGLAPTVAVGIRRDEEPDQRAAEPVPAAGQAGVGHGEPRSRPGPCRRPGRARRPRPRSRIEPADGRVEGQRGDLGSRGLPTFVDEGAGRGRRALGTGTAAAGRRRSTSIAAVEGRRPPRARSPATSWKIGMTLPADHQRRRSRRPRRSPARPPRPRSMSARSARRRVHHALQGQAHRERRQAQPPGRVLAPTGGGERRGRTRRVLRAPPTAAGRPPPSSPVLRGRRPPRRASSSRWRSSVTKRSMVPSSCSARTRHRASPAAAAMSCASWNATSAAAGSRPRSARPSTSRASHCTSACSLSRAPCNASSARATATSMSSRAIAACAASALARARRATSGGECGGGVRHAPRHDPSVPRPGRRPHEQVHRGLVGGIAAPLQQLRAECSRPFGVPGQHADLQQDVVDLVGQRAGGELAGTGGERLRRCQRTLTEHTARRLQEERAGEVATSGATGQLGGQQTTITVEVLLAELEGVQGTAGEEPHLGRHRDGEHGIAGQAVPEPEARMRRRRGAAPGRRGGTVQPRHGRRGRPPGPRASSRTIGPATLRPRAAGDPAPAGLRVGARPTSAPNPGPRRRSSPIPRRSR